MKMKVKKIRNIEKSVCFAEQKIAYNYAFSFRDMLEKINNSGKMEFVKAEMYQDIVNMVIDGVKRNGIDQRYNIDAIIHCFTNGIEKYLSEFSVLNSYEDIGRIFSCSYEIE